MTVAIQEYLTRRIATSKEIQAATGLNQSAVARQLKALGDSIIKIPNGRSPQYALTCNAFGGGDRLRLSMVDQYGNDNLVAFVRPLASGGFFLDSLDGLLEVLLGDQGNGLYDDLPFFLYDLSPQGFLGRHIAAEMARQSDDFPTDPRYWGSNHIGRYLLSNGDDLPGNFKLGEQSHLRLKRKPDSVTEDDYPALADSVMSGVLPRSSAGGEQPKFTAYNINLGAHVIVKFSPKGSGEIARRWRDILITEFHATEVIRAHNLPAAQTRLIEKGDRLFLESIRFDRIGEYGRKSMISLHAIDSEYTGLGSNWVDVAAVLQNKQLISDEDYYDIRMLWKFGRLINNTDMHLGNLSFSINENGFRLSPVYDMCSMGFAPLGNGEVMPYEFTRPNLALESADDEVVCAMADDFWDRVGNDGCVSVSY